MPLLAKLRSQANSMVRVSTTAGVLLLQVSPVAVMASFTTEALGASEIRVVRLALS